MMISTDEYYEMHLKGKSIQQIETSIRGLKQESNHLKNAMEGPDNEFGETSCLDEFAQLAITREYLQRAKSALQEAGGTYIPSKVEIKAENFDSAITQISKVTVSVGSWINKNRYVATLSGETLIANLENGLSSSSLILRNKDGEILSKSTFLNAIRDLHIGEWRKHYSTERFSTGDTIYMIFDGTQWSLEIEYLDGLKPAKFTGDNAYPYNFHELEGVFSGDEIPLETEFW